MTTPPAPTGPTPAQSSSLSSERFVVRLMLVLGIVAGLFQFAPPPSLMPMALIGGLALALALQRLISDRVITGSERRIYLMIATGAVAVHLVAMAIAVIT